MANLRSNAKAAGLTLPARFRTPALYSPPRAMNAVQRASLDRGTTDMSRTYFHDFNRDDGAPVTVEYGVEGSYSPTTYSPHSGAVGGDAPEFSIISCWPNSEEYMSLIRERNAMVNDPRSWIPRDPMLFTGEEAERFEELSKLIFDMEKACALTDAERERMEAWLCEHVPTWDIDDEPTF